MVRLIRTAHPGEPALDMALTHALLDEVAAGGEEVARVFRPGPTLAFGRLDQLRPGFPAAVAAAREHGFAPVLRLGGGHAAAYDAGSVVVEVVTREPAVAEGIERRFRAGTALLVEALRAAGVDPAVGELPGEYCPGTWSVHAGGVKLGGTAQRSVRGASLLGAVLTVEGGDRLRAALVDVYAALGLAWDPSTAGAAEDLAPGATAQAVEQALIAALDAADAELGPTTLEHARALQAAHTLHPR